MGRLLLLPLLLLLGCATSSPPPLPDDPEAAIAAIRRDVESGTLEPALAKIETLLDRREARAHHEEARFLRAVVYHRQKRYALAFRSFTDFVETYPISRHLREVENELFQMGVTLLEGAGGGFLGIPRFLGTALSGTEVLRKLRELNPSGVHAADAQRIVAQTLFDAGDFAMAQIEYQALIDDHPGSVWQPLAEYRVPLCKLLHSRGAAYDRKILEDALKGFEEYERKHPGGDYVHLARRHAREVHDMLAEKCYRTGDFYRRDKRMNASVFYLKQTVEQYPETVWARRALAALASVAQEEPDTEPGRSAARYLKMKGQ